MNHHWNYCPCCGKPLNGESKYPQTPVPMPTYPFYWWNQPYCTVSGTTTGGETK